MEVVVLSATLHSEGPVRTIGLAQREQLKQLSSKMSLNRGLAPSGANLIEIKFTRKNGRLYIREKNSEQPLVGRFHPPKAHDQNTKRPNPTDFKRTYSVITNFLDSSTRSQISNYRLQTLCIQSGSVV